jgi:hypothetical protein
MTRRRLFPDGPELDTRWMADAACADVPGLPWIDSPRRVPTVLVELMAEICATCPVLERCAVFVDEAAITAGYWAGTSRQGYTVQDLPRRRTGRGGAAA